MKRSNRQQTEKEDAVQRKSEEKNEVTSTSYPARTDYPLPGDHPQNQGAGNNQGAGVAQRQADTASTSASQGQATSNHTGLPDQLKSGIENLSGYSMDDVKVHYNSGKPAQLQAHAYAQGTDIHLAPGQEQHLPHEAWHVVQQKQGRVKPTMQLKGKTNINDDAGLEKEADVMGAKAQKLGSDQNFPREGDKPLSEPKTSKSGTENYVQRVLAPPDINPDFLDVIHTNMGRAGVNRQGHRQIRNLAMQLDQNDLQQMYTRALAYIGGDPTGQGLLTKIRNWGHNVTVKIGYDEKTVTKVPDLNGANQDITIIWNPLMFLGVWSEGNWDLANQGGVMSPAAVLLHEFGHACQYIDDANGYRQSRDNGNDKQNLIRNTFEGERDIFPMEHHNMARNEIPFNKAKNEPVRDKYTNAVANYDFEYDPNVAPNNTISQEFDARIQYIINNGWVAAVDHHTNVNEGNDHRVLNDTYFNSDNLGTVMDNDELIYASAIMYMDNYISPYLGNNPNYIRIRGGLRNLIRYLNNWAPLSAALKARLDQHVSLIFRLLRLKGQRLQGLDGDWGQL